MLMVQAVLIVLLVDFLSGLVHWAEDTFWTEDTPIVGRWVVAPNALHHVDGSAFVARSWLGSSWDLLLAGVLVLAWCAASGHLGWQAWLFVLVGVNANQFHKWAHAPRGQVPAPVRWLQRARILQPPAHHAGHHRGGKNTRYCVVTVLLDPLLDRSGFWRALEAVLVPLFGAPRRTDIAARA